MTTERRPDRAGERRAMTLLFSDVVGSTTTLSEIGDARWGARLRAHKRALREIVGRCGGRVVDETGDGVFAAFPSASQALRAAAEMATGLREEADLPVRVGVHSGEVQVTGTDVTGVAVHAAARVMGLGTAAEVVVSRTSVDQVRGAGFRFGPATEHELKGLDGAWSVQRLDLDHLPDESDDEDDEDDGPVGALHRRAGHRSDRGGRRALLRPAVVAAAVVALAVTSGVVLLDPSDAGPDRLARSSAGQEQPGAEPATERVAAVDAAWSAARPMALARQQMSAVALPASLVVAGGLVDGGVTDTVEVYEPAIDAWRPGPALPLPLHHTASAVWQDHAVVIGGWSPKGGRLTAVTSDRVFVLRDGTWQDLPPLLRPRAAAAAVTVGDVVVVTGGQGEDGELLSSTEVFDGTQWREAAPLPTARDHLAVTTDGTHAYAVGGRELSAAANVAAADRYDPRTDTWERLPDLPAPRGDAAAAVVGDRLVLLGGEAADRVLDSALVLDLARRTWSPAPDLVQGRHGAAAVTVDGSVFLLGGATAVTHDGSTADVAVLDLLPE